MSSDMVYGSNGRQFYSHFGNILSYCHVCLIDTTPTIQVNPRMYGVCQIMYIGVIYIPREHEVYDLIIIV